MTDSGSQHDKLIAFLETLRTAGGFDFTYRIAPSAAGGSPPLLHEGDPQTETAASADTDTPAATEVVLEGSDVPLLLERNAELLHAFESLATAVLRLAPEQGEQLSFDAGNFKADRAESIQSAATAAIEQVRSSGEPFIFPPMNARERRMLHMALSTSGLSTASSGEGPRRFVVLYPEGHTPEPERFAPPPPPRRTFGRPGSGGGNRPGRPSFGGPRRGPWQPRPSGGPPRDTAPRNFADTLPGERRDRPEPARTDPNGNPIENPALTPDDLSDSPQQRSPSVEERLAKLRRNFRQR